MPSHEHITVKVYTSQEKNHLPSELDRRNPLSKPLQRHASSANQIAHLHSLSTTELLSQACCLSGLPLINSNLSKQSPKLNESKGLGHPLPHPGPPGPPFDILAAARYKKAANNVHPVWTTLKNIKSFTAFCPILSFHSHSPQSNPQT